MIETSLEVLVLLFTIGLGLFIVGGANYLLSRQSGRTRLIVAGIGIVVCTAPPLLAATPHVLPAALAAIIAIASLVPGLASSAFSNWVSRKLEWIRSRKVQAATLLALGAGLMLLSLAWLDTESEEPIRLESSFLDNATSSPELRKSMDAGAATDDGTSIALYVPADPRPFQLLQEAEGRLLSRMNIPHQIIRLAPASDQCNCHGWVFTSGRFWINPKAVEMVLKENGYESTTHPEAGDVVVYHVSRMITHSGIVHSVEDSGEVLVRSKWGWMGVYLHRVEDAPYGRTWNFYRTNRGGDLLWGLEAKNE